MRSFPSESRRLLRGALMEQIREAAEELLHWAEELNRLEAMEREPESSFETGHSVEGPDSLLLLAVPGGAKPS
jgi:hypothetical protein